MFRIPIALGLAACSTLAAAQPYEHWSDNGAWQILVDPARGPACLAQKTFDDGTLVQLGAVPVQEGGFFAAYNPAWTDIKAGDEGTLTFDFGDERFAGEVVGQNHDGTPGGYAFFDNPAFLTEFAKRQEVTVSGEGGHRIRLDLTGTSKTIDAVLACQKAQPAPHLAK